MEDDALPTIKWYETNGGWYWFEYGWYMSPSYETRAEVWEAAAEYVASVTAQA